MESNERTATDLEASPYRASASRGDLQIAVRLAILETEMACGRRAIELQAKEYERRLMELNHAHEQQMARNSEYLSRESWEMHLSDLNKWRLEVDKWHWLAIGVGISVGGIAGAFVQWLLHR